MLTIHPFLIEFVFPAILLVGIVVIVLRCFRPGGWSGGASRGAAAGGTVAEGEDGQSLEEPEPWKSVMPIWYMLLAVITIILGVLMYVSFNFVER